MNASVTFLNVDNSILHTKSNACGTIAIPVIEKTFENHCTHIMHCLLKIYIYVYVISKSTVPEAATQSVI